ncbi:MAG: alpha/beta hydrolase [Capnocytophaga sp.]|nr:alpha/beta hydrolase [Capnocytophaga sp.]
MLIIHGNRDNVVPFRYAQRTQTTFPKATLREIQGAGHIFSAQQNRELFPFIREYLTTQVK